MDKHINKVIIECEQIVPFLKVISNTTRLKILCILKNGEQKVGDIQQMLGAKQSYISQQLKFLKSRGYLSSRREGTQIYYGLADDKFPRLLEMMRSILDK